MSNGANGAYFCNYPAGTGSQPVMIGNRLSFYGSDHGFFDTIIGDPTVVSATIEVEHTCKAAAPQSIRRRNRRQQARQGRGDEARRSRPPDDGDRLRRGRAGRAPQRSGPSRHRLLRHPSLGWVFDQWTSATDPLTTPESLNDYLFFIGHPPFTKDRTVTATFVQASKLRSRSRATGGRSSRMTGSREHRLCVGGAHGQVLRI